MLGELLGMQAQQTAALQAGKAPVWTTAYGGTNYTNNNLGNNDGAPDMQATLNDPHAAILAPPAPVAVAATAPPVNYGPVSDATLPGGGGNITGPNGTEGASGTAVSRSKITGGGVGPTGTTEPGDPSDLANQHNGMIASLKTQYGGTTTPSVAPTPTAQSPRLTASTTPTTPSAGTQVQTLKTAFSRTANNVISKSSMVV